MIPAPDKAFLLAAGLGTRLRPHTDTMPKPMVPVAGRPIIDHALDKLHEAAVKEAWVNTHYLAGILSAHLSGRKNPKIRLSYEETLLNTGGGIKKCRNFLKDSPFYLINGDAFWSDGEKPALVRLYEAFDLDKMDILLLLQPIKTMVLTQGVGDYDLIGDVPVRNPDKKGQYMFTGIRLVHPDVFDYKASEPELFSFLALMDEAQKQGRLAAIIHDGAWHHISTPEDLARVEAAMAGR